MYYVYLHVLCICIILLQSPNSYLGEKQDLAVSPACFFSPNHLSFARDCPALHFHSYCFHQPCN